MIEFISKIDYRVAKYFHDLYLWAGDFASGLMEAISFVAEAGILFLLIGFGLALFKRTRKIGVAVLMSVAIGFVFTNVILKPMIARARPFANIDSDFYRWWLDAGAVAESGHSFPSGHTTATTAFALAIFLTTNKKFSWPILLLPISMACSRIYLMVHYFSDCVGGLVVGSIGAVLAYLVVKLIYSSKIKFFVWIKEFDVFKPKSSTKAVFAKSPQSNKTEPIEEMPEPVFEYKTQKEESSSNGLKTESSGQPDTKNLDKNDDLDNK